MGLFDGTPLEDTVVCSRCGQALKQCQCPPVDERSVEPSRQQLKVTVEKRHRGKIVTLVTGFQGSPSDFQYLLSELKNSCGAGGTLAEQTLEIQGDQQSRVSEALLNKGYHVGGQRKKL